VGASAAARKGLDRAIFCGLEPFRHGPALASGRPLLDDLGILKAGDPFFNLYSHDLVRVAVAVPRVRVADPAYNAEQTVALLRQADARQAILVIFPELGLSAYTCDDLFHQGALLDAAEAALSRVLEASASLNVIGVVGLPLRVDDRLFNCAVVLQKGLVLGVVPKLYLPNYREFYELRQFASGHEAHRASIDLAGQKDIPFGSELLFRSRELPLFRFHVEICEDLWVPIAPSSRAALAGATVLLNLSASNITVAKAEYRRQLVGNQSARCLAAYVFTAAGYGESTTDLAWDGHALIYENGNLLAESKRFEEEPQLICTELDLERLVQERMRQTTFGDNAAREAEALRRFRNVSVSIEAPRAARLLPERRWERFPYVPSHPAQRAERSAEVYRIQVHGLVKRLESAQLDRVVIGVSGGLDSTHALLVCAQAMDHLKLPRKNILAYTMPGFATSERSLEQARALMLAIGCEARELDIRPACLQMLADIQHPFSRGEPVHDITFENVQAGERTSHLFRLANLHKAIVIGTGDLSELALGWCTYGVGDHMSHYAVNASVPKTLMRFVIRWIAETDQLGANASDVLLRIVEMPSSPELVPAGTGTNTAQPFQDTETSTGPYELQDFNLYYTSRFGYRPTKVAFLAWCAWRERDAGDWPGIPAPHRRAYELWEIKSHLESFSKKFFGSSQFKRSCIPNGPKIGSGGSLSPRGDWRAPSDGEPAPWLAQLALVPDTE
jgi:NAD+ synthase (glutamine-hydrolysing)